MQTLKPIDIQSVHTELQDRIRGYILSNALQPNTPLPSESDLAAQLGVSRPAVREALRSLESLGVIYSRRGQGWFVNHFTFDPIISSLNYDVAFDLHEANEILDIRERLEAGFIEDAIAHTSQDAIDELTRIVEVMKCKADQGIQILEEDLEFHRTLFGVTGNRLLVKLLDVFWHVYINLRDKSVHNPKSLKADVENHERILRAVAEQDAEAARHAIVEHFGNIRSRIRSKKPGIGV